MTMKLLIMATLALIVGGGGPADAFDHGAFNELLQQYVDEEGRVDYSELKKNRARLDGYLAGLARADAARLGGRPGELAFWINAYNAAVLKGVIDAYPIKSVRDISGFFDRRRYKVAGQELTLDQIELRLRQMGDPRIHFAIVCASRSCPKLERRAYSAEDIEAELERQTRAFINDEQRGVRIDRAENVVYLSKIFEWYSGEFLEAGEVSGLLDRALVMLKPARVLPYVLRYLDPEKRRCIENKRPRVTFMDYDWSLNDQAR